MTEEVGKLKNIMPFTQTYGNAKMIAEKNCAKHNRIIPTGGHMMEFQPLPIGVENFEELRREGYYYVDKTNMIRDLLDRKGKVTLFTRPRRFGKTLNMSMLQCFFEDARSFDGKAKDLGGLFEGLNIMQAGEKYLAHKGQYPVVSLTLKGGKQPDFALAYDMLVRQIAKEYERHAFILKDERLQGRKKTYLNIMQGDAPRSIYNSSLQYLTECLELYYGKKAILLIDEYDVPLENAYLCGFYQEMISFIHSLFESAFKTNPSIAFAVLTGCLRISKESIFTGMNNLEVVSILNQEYDEYFGFTDDEVQKICSAYHLEDRYGQIRKWYNGYIFGNTNVYNPWSLVQFVKNLTTCKDSPPKAYWANTSSNSIVRKLIDHADDSTKEEIELLIGGGEIEKPVHEDITYDEIYKTMDNLWNFMFFTGYFRKVRERFDERERKSYLTLKIPNFEVDYIFREKVSYWFEEKVKERDRSRLYQAVIEKDAAVFEEELNDIMLETISFMDYHESYYHGLVTGILTGIKGYITKSNREGGTGRSDLFIKPVSRRKEAFVLEFKVAKSIPEMEEKAEEAIRQIEEKQYARELFDEGYGRVSMYGIAFFGKECAVKHKE